MNVSVNLYAIILLLSGLTTMSVSLLIYRRLKHSERSFSVVLGLAGWWAIGSAGEHSSITLASKLFWLQFEYVAICFLPVALLVFTRVFISNQPLKLTRVDAFIFFNISRHYPAQKRRDIARDVKRAERPPLFNHCA